MAELIYKEPLKVICIKTGNSKKLIKGAIYFATYNIARSNGKIKENYVNLKDTGSYKSEYFTTLDNINLTKYPEFKTEQIKSIDTSKNDYTGQFIKCRYSTGNLKDNEIYYVEEQRNISKNSNRYIAKLKIRGFRNLINPYRFTEIPISEQRKIKLKNLGGECVKTGEQTRKFLLYTEKEKIFTLYQVLARTLFDMKRIEFNENPDIIKLMLIRCKEHGIIEEDITTFLKQKPETLLKKFK